MMGIYALTHLPGNLLAGQGIDRHGSKPYMVFSLITAGIVLLLQSMVTDPWQLLILRAISGFVLAFLSPACLAMLTSLTSNPAKQGKLLAGNGVVHTLAAVGSPAAGAFLAAKIGFSFTFQVLGWLLITTGIIAIFTIKENRKLLNSTAHPNTNSNSKSTPSTKFNVIPYRYYLLPLAISCSQGILFFELPLQAGGGSNMMDTGVYFSIIGLGSLMTLAMLFLHHVPPLFRTQFGILCIALAFFSLAALPQIPMLVTLFILGMAKGVVYPAMASLFIELSGGQRLGTVFSLQAIAMSTGSFIGPIVAGAIHGSYSPYFIAFIILMICLTLSPSHNFTTVGSHTRV
ncbi:drug efflux system protein MdtG [compost metagenome]